VPLSLPPVSPPSRRLGMVTIAGTSLAISLLGGSLWLAGEKLAGSEARSNFDDQVRAAQSAADTLLSMLKDAETGQRGYLLTGNPAYLEPYNSARARLDADFERLDHAPLTNPAQAQQIRTLRTLAASKLAELAATISLRQSGQADAAVDRVRTDQGKRIMDSIRGEVSVLQTAAQLRLDQARHKAKSDPAWGLVGSLAALGCLVLGGIIILQTRANRLITAGFTRITEFSRALVAADEERKQANALLQTIVETAPGLIYAKDFEGRMLLANAATMNLIGKSWTDVRGRTDREFLDDPAQGAVIMLTDRRVMQTGQVEEIEELVGTNVGQVRVWLSTKTPLKDLTGKIRGLVGVSVEITERKRMEERLKLMVDELNHRVKNTLATVQSIAMQTLRGTDAQIRRTLEMRLLALSSAHDALTRERWVGANLVDIVTAILAPHGSLEDGRIHFSGPPVRLVPRAVVAMGLGLHELATNALKYGALSVDEGRVDVLWDVVTGDTTLFRLLWTERNGPPVVPPERRGFGSRLIEISLAQDLRGVALIRFGEQGIICEIEAPLAEIAAPIETLPFPHIGKLMSA